MENIEHGANPTHVGTFNKQEVFKDLFAEMLSYYVRNVKSLSKDEQNDFLHFDKANNAQQLKSWADNIHITGGMGDMVGIELANLIKNTDNTSLDAWMKYAKQDNRFVNEKTEALTKQINDIKGQDNEYPVILFRNGQDNFTAIGKDAQKVADALGIMPDSKINDLDVANINSAGAFLLFKNATPYKVMDPVTDISSVNGADNEISATNKMMLQMGNLAVISNGNTVRFDTQQQIFGNELNLELKKGLFSFTQIDENDKMAVKAIPIQQFDTFDGKSMSYLYDMTASELKNLQAFFNDNFNSLKKNAAEYGNTRKNLDDNLNSLIGQNDRLAKENPDTIILIKQRGFIEAFSDSAINAANTLGLQLYNRSNHKGDVTVPFTRMTVEDYKKLVETDNNVYLARPRVIDNMTDANLSKVNGPVVPSAARTQQQNSEKTEQNRSTFKR